MGGWLSHGSLNDPCCTPLFHHLCKLKWGQAILVFGIKVSTSLDENLSNFCMILPSRHVQWGHATLGFGIKVSAGIDEDLSDFCMAIPSRKVQWCRTHLILGFGIKVSASIDEDLSNF